MWSSNDGWTVERTSPKSKRRRVGNEAEAEAAAGEEVEQEEEEEEEKEFRALPLLVKPSEGRAAYAGTFPPGAAGFMRWLDSYGT